MREKIRDYRKGDVLKADDVRNVNQVARRVSTEVPGANLAGKHTSHIAATTALPPFLQRPLEVIELNDPNDSSSSGVENQYVYKVRPLIYVDGEWVKNEDEGPYNLDAKITQSQLTVGDRVHGYWDANRGKFLLLQSRARAECKAFADFGGKCPQLRGDFAENYPFYVNCTLAMWLQVIEDPENPYSGAQKVINGRVNAVPLVRGQLNPNLLDQYTIDTSLIGYNSFSVGTGSTYVSLFAQIVDDIKFAYTTASCSIRLEIKGTTKTSPDVTVRSYAAITPHSAIGHCYDMFMEVGSNGYISEQETPEANMTCPYFKVAASGKAIEIVVPLTQEVRDLIAQIIDDDYTIEDDDGEIVVDSSGKPIITPEQQAAIDRIIAEYQPFYCVEAECRISGRYTETGDGWSDDSCGCGSSGSSASTSSSSISGDNSSSSMSTSSMSSSPSSQSLSSSSSNSPSSLSSQSGGFSDLSSMSSSS